MSIVYLVTNRTDGKQYVGITSQTFEKRHRAYFVTGAKSNRPLRVAMRELGVDAFTMEILEECTDEILLARETYWIKELNTLVPGGYNVTLEAHKGGSPKRKKGDGPEIDLDVLNEERRRRREVSMAKYSPEQVARWDEFEALYPKLIARGEADTLKDIERELRKKLLKGVTNANSSNGESVPA